MGRERKKEEWRKKRKWRKQRWERGKEERRGEKILCIGIFLIWYHDAKLNDVRFPTLKWINSFVLYYFRANLSPPPHGPMWTTVIYAHDRHFL